VQVGAVLTARAALVRGVIQRNTEIVVLRILALAVGELLVVRVAVLQVEFLVVNLLFAHIAHCQSGHRTAHLRHRANVVVVGGTVRV
jgi:hypothetical protein